MPLTLESLSGEGQRLYAPHGELLSHAAVVVQTATPPTGAVWLGGDFYRVADPQPLVRARALIAAGAQDAFPDLVREHVRAEPVAVPDDPLYAGQWYLDELGMELLYAHSYGDAEVRIAVVDSGIDIDHTDLVDRVTAPYDAFSDDDDPSPDPGEYCSGSSTDICDSHGTSVAGISVATAFNGFGMVGMCPECTLIPIKLLGESSGALSAEIAAFQHALDNDAWVVNNSWGYTEYTPAPRMLADLIDRVATETRGGLGAVVVFAAGNDNREIFDDEIEALDSVLCVSATDSYGNATNYSNYGNPVDVAAPSATVTIVPDDGDTTTFGGTSAAAPVVSGLAGWVLSVAPELSAAEVRELLIRTAEQSPLVIPDENGHTDAFGYGSVSPLNIEAELFSPLAEDPGGGCGCAVADPLGAGALMLGLLAVRRRRC